MGVGMANDNGAGAGSVMLAFLVGAVAGAAVALLYAPATGQETREFLGEKAREGRDRATEAAAKGREVDQSRPRNRGNGYRTWPRGVPAGPNVVIGTPSREGA